MTGLVHTPGIAVESVPAHRMVMDEAALAAFRRERQQAPLKPYEPMQEKDVFSNGTVTQAERIMTEGWKPGSLEHVKVIPPVDWEGACSDHRSWQFRLHCWEPLGPVLSALDHTGDPRYLEFAMATALDWIARYPSLDDPSTFAWYDMAIGIRAWRLGYLVDVAARTESCGDRELDALIGAIMLHAQALADDALFPAHSNHGLFFAAGQAALARRFPLLPGMTDAAAQSAARLRRLIHSQFTSEGVHREHSPDYHWMMLELLENLRDAGLLDGTGYDEFSERIQEAMAWFTLPNGRLAIFGDSTWRLMPGRDYGRFRNPALRFVLSDGREGQPPQTSVGAFPESGYVVYRSGWPDGPDDPTDWTYLAQACAFHSRTHKHADDLTFVWYDRGHEILTDAGRYGYLGRTPIGSDSWKDGFWYSDPHRMYVESTRAHNTVEVDGRNFPRRGVEPYGSSLLRWAEESGLFLAESATVHWETIGHRRLLVLRPGEWLLVHDTVWDEETQPHRFVQRFHFAPELDVATHGSDGLLATLPGGGEPLHVIPLLDGERLDPVRGQVEPDRLGWISREAGEMIPAWTGAWAAADRPGHTFATLFAFGEEAPRALAVPPSGNDEEGASRLRWQHRGQVHRLTLPAPGRGPFRPVYRLTLEDAARGNGAGTGGDG